jgi:hypothetical protein
MVTYDFILVTYQFVLVDFYDFILIQPGPLYNADSLGLSHTLRPLSLILFTQFVLVGFKEFILIDLGPLYNANSLGLSSVLRPLSLISYRYNLYLIKFNPQITAVVLFNIKFTIYHQTQLLVIFSDSSTFHARSIQLLHECKLVSSDLTQRDKLSGLGINKVKKIPKIYNTNSSRSDQPPTTTSTKSNRRVEHCSARKCWLLRTKVENKVFIFNSLKDASTHLKINVSTISRSLKSGKLRLRLSKVL